jgi:multidrug efflux system outer membrane protein
LARRRPTPPRARGIVPENHPDRPSGHRVQRAGQPVHRGTFAWAGGATLSYPIFKAGAAKATARQAAAQQEAALAAYRKSVQSAFSDVANVLARRGTIADQLDASTAARDAARDNYTLTDQRYQGGINGYLDVLTAQQTLYTSEKTLIATVLADGANRVSLYRALGGDRLEANPG